mmetsp:Transcript_58721/g.70050  ORF Transcript_58721/g.70050 Transcript_58721/m.70050 type:complete len:90 (-) Transcript_58721:139-408(-)
MWGQLLVLSWSILKQKKGVAVVVVVVIAGRCALALARRMDHFVVIVILASDVSSRSSNKLRLSSNKDVTDMVWTILMDVFTVTHVTNGV